MAMVLHIMGGDVSAKAPIILNATIQCEEKTDQLNSFSFNLKNDGSEKKEKNETDKKLYETYIYKSKEVADCSNS